MYKVFSIILLIDIVCYNPALARPDLLKQQRYEFPEYHTSASYDHISSPEIARLDVVPVTVQLDSTLWSQHHQNEVNAFAEMFRQSYNQMIEQYNKMIEMHHHVLINPLTPVTYELYHISDDVQWKNYFGIKQEYVHYQTDQMSRQLIQNLEEGRVSPQDLMNPNFFISQAASELNRFHQEQHEIDTNNQHDSSNLDGSFQQHQFNDQEQQKHHVFEEFANHETISNAHSIVAYNQGTGDYESVPVVAALVVPTPEKLESGIIHNRNLQNSSNIEIQTPISVEVPKHQVNASSHKQLQIEEDEFYGSTYDQQPIFDLRFVNRVLSTERPSMVNVMPLVRNKNNVKISTTTSSTPSTTTVVATTERPTTETNIMSMLPNKKLPTNYTDIYRKVQATLDSQMKQISDNASEETHFMGMTSNTDHVKLSYETIVAATDHKNNRGDQPSNSDDNIFEEYVEPEPGLGYYSVNTEPVVSIISVVPSSTPSHISTTTKQNQTFRNLDNLFTAPLAPFSTITKQSSNPYYSAPLAPFPDNVQQLTAQTQMITETPTPVSKPQMNNWLQRQFFKLKNAF